MCFRLFAIGSAVFFLVLISFPASAGAIGASTLTGTCSPTRVTLSWTPVSDANSNAIQKGWTHGESYWEWFFTSDTPPFDTYSLEDTDLQPNTVYEYRVKTDAQVSSNIFRCDTTAAAPPAPPPPAPPQVKPSVTTQAAGGISRTDATLNGLVNPNGAAAEVWFEIGTNDTSLVETPHDDLAAGDVTVSRTLPVSGLNTDTTYFFRIAAGNSAGIARGNIFNFKTLAGPAASAPTADIRANGQGGTVSISYSASAQISWSSTNATSCTVSPTNWTGTSGSRSSGKLTSSKTFTVNCIGAGGGASKSVTVQVGNAPLPPPADRPSADLRINGSDGPLTVRADETFTLEWNSRNADSCTVVPGDFRGTSGRERYGNIPSETTFYATCLGPGGSVTDRVLLRVSAPSAPPPPTAQRYPPTAVTLGPSDMGLNYVVVNGYVNPNGVPTEAWFEYGPSESLSRTTAPRSIGSGRSSVSFSSEMAVEMGQEYFYRIVARNAYGVSRGGMRRVVAASGQLFVIEPGFKNLKAGERVQFRAWYDEDGSGPGVRRDVSADTVWISEDTQVIYHDRHASFVGVGVGQTKVLGVYSPDGPVRNVNDIGNLRGEAVIIIEGGEPTGPVDVMLGTSGSTSEQAPPEQRSNLLRNALWGFLVVLLIAAVIFGAFKLREFLRNRE